jgi:hypothetical protein
MTPDSEGLHPIANTDLAERVADIVFVHGLGGSSRVTSSLILCEKKAFQHTTANRPPP